MTRIIVVIVLVVFLWFPLCIPEEITALRYGAMMSVVGMLYVSILVAI